MFSSFFNSNLMSESFLYILVYLTVFIECLIFLISYYFITSNFFNFFISNF